MTFIVTTLILWVLISIFSYAIAAFSEHRIRNIIGLSLFFIIFLLIFPGYDSRSGSTYKTTVNTGKPFYNCYLLDGCKREITEQPYALNYRNDQINWLAAIAPPFLIGIILGLSIRKSVNAKIKTVKKS